MREARRAVGLDQADVARQLGVTPGAVSQWETGETEPRAGYLVALAALYSVDAGVLLREDDPPVALNGSDADPADPADPTGTIPTDPLALDDPDAAITPAAAREQLGVIDAVRDGIAAAQATGTEG